MQEQNNFQFPIFTIAEVKPLLKKGEKVFAYEIIVADDKGKKFTIHDNKGTDLSNYIGVKAQFLLEITQGSFEYKNDDGKVPEDTMAFSYQWLKRPYEFFPELEKLKSIVRESSGAEEEKLREDFETTAEKKFKEWGIGGLNIGVYDAKPLLKSEAGIFFLNEYEFEEELEYMELNEEVYIRIERLYLRGVNPLAKGEEKVFHDKVEQVKEEEKKESPKRRFTFLD